MKNFLSKNWKKILIIIGIILIVLNIISKTTAPHTLVQDYAKYGANVEASNIKISTDAIANDFNESKSNMPSSIMRLALLLGIGILAIAIISDLAEKKPAGKKK